MICYHWAEGPKFYEETSTWVVLALEASLQRAGQDPWLDRTGLSTDAKDLVKMVGDKMERKKMVIICIGAHDLERCKNHLHFSILIIVLFVLLQLGHNTTPPQMSQMGTHSNASIYL